MNEIEQHPLSPDFSLNFLDDMIKKLPQNIKEYTLFISDELFSTVAVEIRNLIKNYHEVYKRTLIINIEVLPRQIMNNADCWALKAHGVNKIIYSTGA